jgi:hypothetical protein
MFGVIRFNPTELMITQVLMVISCQGFYGY